MKLTMSIIIALSLIVIGGLGLWGYGFFFAPESVEAITAKWEISGHADAESVSFTRWADDDPPEIPITCARCHSMDGYLDFLGADGSTAGVVDQPVLGVSILSCRTCHNAPAHEITEVTFPSGNVAEEQTRAVSCMQCHQGRQSTPGVDERLTGLEPDVVNEELGFLNVHYAVGAATLLGGDAEVGYQYPGKSYVGRFAHVEDYNTCIDCHDPHSTFRNPDQCSPCHLNVVTQADLRDIRVSGVDYDGDGDVDKPIREEVATLHNALHRAIQDYAADVVGEPIVYDRDTFPYFFDPTADELTFANRYATWTPRLVRATYNYRYVHADPGAYVHNARYVLQLLYDSLEDLGQAVPVEMDSFVRP